MESRPLASGGQELESGDVSNCSTIYRRIVLVQDHSLMFSTKSMIVRHR
jgi:hypothetical protein